MTQVVKPTLATFLTRLTYDSVLQYKKSLDSYALRYRKEAETSMSKVRPLLELQYPLKPVHELNLAALHENWGLSTPATKRMFTSALVSSLLCVAPFRRKNITALHVSVGPVPFAPKHESLHVFVKEAGNGYGRYGLVVPVERMKNGYTSGRLRRLNPPRVVRNLHVGLDPFIDRYLEGIRGDSPSSPELGPLFPVAPNTVPGWIRQFQLLYLVEQLGLNDAFSLHPYRVLVATHLIKNAPHRHVELAADMLLDAPDMIEKVYGHFRPEDSQVAADAILSPTGWLNTPER